MTKFAWFSVVCLQTLHLALCPTGLEPQNAEAKLGHDVTLQCQGPRDDAIELLEWTRSDLKPEDYVFFFRDGRVYEKYHHPSFRGRVKLRNPQLKDGDFSVILENVTINDTGTYECNVTNNKSRINEFMCSITLTVTGGGAGHTEDGGDTGGGDTGGGDTGGGDTGGGDTGGGDTGGGDTGGGDTGGGDKDGGDKDRGHIGLIVGVTVVSLLLLLLLVLGCFVRQRKRKALTKQNQPLAKERGDDERHMLNESVDDSLDSVSVMTHPDQNQSY